MGFVRNSVLPGAYAKAFTAVKTVIVTHNLGYKPTGIQIEDSSGEDKGGKVVHNSVNQFTVTFRNNSTGTIRYK